MDHGSGTIETKTAKGGCVMSVLIPMEFCGKHLQSQHGHLGAVVWLKKHGHKVLGSSQQRDISHGRIR